jgi:hypothetical protein
MTMTENVQHPSVRELQQHLMIVPTSSRTWLLAHGLYVVAVWLQDIALQLSEQNALRKLELGIDVDLSRTCGVR